MNSKTSDNHEILVALKAEMKGAREQLDSVINTLSNLTGNGKDPTGGKIGRMDRELQEVRDDVKSVREKDIQYLREKIMLFAGIGIGFSLIATVISIISFIRK